MNDDEKQVSSRPEDSESQQKILAAARTEFAAHGKAGGRIDRIAAKAGVNKAMIYYHYSSKDKLYFEAVFSVLTDARTTFASVFQEGQSFEEVLLGIAGIYQALFTCNPDYRAMMLRELADPQSPVLDMLAERFVATGMPERFIARLQQEIEAGAFRQIDIRQALVSFLMMNIGYHLTAPLVTKVMGVSDREKFLKERNKAVVDLFLNGVRARS